MGEAVIEVQSQAAEALSQRNRQSVVVGISNRAPRGQRTVLRLNEPSRKEGDVGEWAGRSTRTVEKSCSHLIDESLRIGPVIAAKKREGVVAGLPSALQPIEHLRRGPG